jgi:hypothetical protein
VSGEQASSRTPVHYNPRKDIMAVLRFIAKDPGSPQGGSPTLWLDEDDGSLVVQGWRLDAETLAQVLATGAVPPHETVVRIPARMLTFLKEVAGVDPASAI